MSLTILQTPGNNVPAQSPVVFSVLTSGGQSYTASEFQYTANLYLWSGQPEQSGSYIYSARKYPNVSGSGIFDFGRLINSQLTDLSAENDSNIKYYKVDFGYQYESASLYVTQSSLTGVSASVSGVLFTVYDGYAVFPDNINESFANISTCYPFMTDMCTVTQSIQLTDSSELGSGSYRAIPLWRGAGNPAISSLQVTASYANGTTLMSSENISLVGTVSSSKMVYNSKGFPGDSWSSLATTNGGSSLKSYTVSAISGSGAKMATLAYEIENECYYEPVKIAYKNKYGQFDWFNFYKRHDITFNTDQRLYQPQLGTWSSPTLTYSKFQTRQQRYIVDATEVLSVNTDYIEEGYNELFKQLLVSDEIYWVTNNDGTVRPLTVQTNSLQFRTHVNTKLIQYTLVFDLGQPFKLIL